MRFGGSARSAALRWGAALCWAVIVATAPLLVAAAPPNAVEIEDASARMLDVQVTRRLIRIELGEVDFDVPPAPRGVRLYFRVLLPAEGVLAIELWDRGKFIGERRVSAEGTELLRARRLALAAGELARAAKQQLTLAQRRLRQAQLAKQVEPPSSVLLPASVRLAPALHAAAVGGDDLMLLGPRLAAALALHQGPRLDFGLSWQWGRAGLLGGSSSLRWTEAFISPAYSFKLGSSGLDVGLVAGAAAVSLHDVPVSASAREAQHTWSSQLSGLIRFHHPLAGGLRIATALELGHTLRPIAVPSANGEQELGGLWVGLSLGVELTVAGRDAAARGSR